MRLGDVVYAPGWGAKMRPSHLISNGSESLLILVHLYLVNRLSGPTGSACQRFFFSFYIQKKEKEAICSQTSFFLYIRRVFVFRTKIDPHTYALDI